MSEPDPQQPSTGSRVRDLYAAWRYAAVAVLGGAMVVLGLIGYHQSVPGIRFTDALYATIRLFIFEYDLDGEPSLALEVARFGAGAVLYLAVAFAALGILERQLTLARASRMRGHAVVLGNGREAAAIARRVVAAGETQRALLVGDRGAVVTGRTSGVVQVPSVSGDGLRRVVEHARQVYVVGATDEETAALAHRVRGLATAAQQPTTVVLSDRDVAGHWATHAPETVVCRPTRTATATLRLAPPFLDHAMVPPPVVIGDGPVAAELARAIVTGWQQPGERLRVHCLGGDGDWVDEAATGIEERADLVWSPLRANVGGAPRAVLELVRRWPERDPRFTHEGARVYVAYPETSRTVPVAAAIARRVPAVEVIAVVDDADTWSDTLGEGHTLRMLSAQELLTDPATLRLTPADLLAEELVADAARWPDDVPGALGVVVDGDRTARLAAQPAPVRDAVRAVAGGIGEIFAAADIELDSGFPAEVPTLVLSPGELTRIEVALARLLPAGEPPTAQGGEATGRRRADEPRMRRLELAARLPVLAARAGLVPVRRGAEPVPLTDEAVRTLALEVHLDYLRTSAATGNATRSDAAARTWEELSDADRRSSAAQVIDIPVKLAALGLTWRPTAEPQPYRFSDEEIELLAELEHRRWVHFQLRNGRARHTFNVAWSGLADGVQEYDRGPVRLMNRLLAQVGFEIARQPQG